MRQIALACALGLLLATWPGAARLASAEEAAKAPQEALYETIAALDSAVFDAFNRCAEPGQLDRYASYFVPELEFYHDLDGLLSSRQEMVDAVAANICGKVTRERVEGTLEVFPIHGYGAIARGVHRFCQEATGDCAGLADFTIVWQQSDEGWKITRVLSYNHRPNS
jgi:hypothetical protein